jgi:hypothetical protein
VFESISFCLLPVVCAPFSTQPTTIGVCLFVHSNGLSTDRLMAALCIENTAYLVQWPCIFVELWELIDTCSDHCWLLF